MDGQEAKNTAEFGLRERKKARTRDAIRTVSLELFEQQGFERTTLDQICRRADVAHRTFFRYYPTKEALLFGWDFGHLILDAFAAAPAELGPWAAFEHAMVVTDGRLEVPAQHTNRRRALRRRFLDVPTVRDHAIVQIDNFSQRAVVIAADRLGVDFHEDLRPQALGALVAAATRYHIFNDDETRDDRLAQWITAFHALLPAPAPSAPPTGS